MTEITISKKDWEKFIPDCNKCNLRLTDVALYSTTPQSHSEYLIDILTSYIDKEHMKEMVVTDVGACIGGNTFTLLKYFKRVNAVELNKLHAEILLHNAQEIFTKKMLQKLHVYNDDYMAIMHFLKQDVIFMDPPWGGTDYKKNTKLDLKYSNIHLHQVVKSNLQKKTKMFVLKVPTNYDWTLLKNDMKYIKCIPIKKKMGNKISTIYNIIVITNLLQKKDTKPIYFPPVGYRDIKTYPIQSS